MLIMRKAQAAVWFPRIDPFFGASTPIIIVPSFKSSGLKTAQKLKVILFEFELALSP